MTAARETRGDDEYGHLVPLFEKLATMDADDPDRASVRDELVTGHLALAQHIARRFADRGQPMDDLVQVARLALVKAVDRFDPARGTDFLSFAVPTIMGEVRRHFRDSSWSVRVPRRLKELHLAIGAATSELFQRLGHAPTPSELAAHLGISRQEVCEGLEAGNAYRSLSVDSASGTDEDSGPLSDFLGEEDGALEGVEYHESLRPLVRELPVRERRILAMRFYGGMTQTQIAERIGISQMHVSRLLSKTLEHLRQGLSEEE